MSPSQRLKGTGSGTGSTGGKTNLCLWMKLETKNEVKECIGLLKGTNIGLEKGVSVV